MKLTKTDATVTTTILLRGEEINSAYDIERNNRLVIQSFNKLKKARCIEKAEKGYTLNKKNLEKYTKTPYNEFIEYARGIDGMDKIKKNPKLFSKHYKPDVMERILEFCKDLLD